MRVARAALHRGLAQPFLPRNMMEASGSAARVVEEADTPAKPSDYLTIGNLQLVRRSATSHVHPAPTPRHDALSLSWQLLAAASPTCR
jgi:hypothetical protein